MKKADEIEACWLDDRYWKWGLFYCCRKDPRKVVATKLRLGITLNLAHPSTYGAVLLTALAAFLSVWLPSRLGADMHRWLEPILIVDILTIMVLCGRESDLNRYESEPRA